MLTLNYTITPALLHTIKQISLLVHELNKRQIPAELQSTLEAEATSDAVALVGGGQAEAENYLEARSFITSYTATSLDPHSYLNTDIILKTHALVSAGFLPPEQCGQWRNIPITVTEPATGTLLYTPPIWEDVPLLMEPLLSFINDNVTIYDPVILAGLFHRQFAIIRPFTIGNRRTAHLLSNLLLEQLDLSLFPLTCFEHVYLDNLTLYHQQVDMYGTFYNDVKAVDHTNWLEFFASGVLAELQRLDKLLDLRAASPQNELKPQHEQILLLIDQKGFLTDSDYAKHTDRAKATRTLDFNNLMKRGLIERVGKGRATFYRRLQG